MNSHQKTQQYAHCLIIQLLKPPPPQVHPDIPCSRDFRGGEGKESEQEENWGEVCCKVKGWRVGEYHKGGKNQEYEKRGGGMCPGCVG